MTERSEHFEAYDAKITAALEHKPEVPVPAGFALRVASNAARQARPAGRRRPGYGRLAGAMAIALLLLAMFCLAPRMQPSFSSIGFDVELLLLGQLLGIGGWLMMRQSSRAQ